jgi:putative two-component system response regulator
MTHTLSTPIRVAVVDDQEIVRAGLRMVLGAHPDVRVVGEATNGAEVPALVAQTHPDVILMDLRMPEVDGIEATRRLRAHTRTPDDNSPGVLILTTFDLDEHVFEALRAGANAFLAKDSETHDLIEAIKHVYQGDAVVQPRITRQLVEHFISREPSAHPSDEDINRLESLTPREQEVLGLVASGLSNSEIATALTLSEVTIKTHVGRLLTKLSLRDRTQAVVFAYETGFVRPGNRNHLSTTSDDT